MKDISERLCLAASGDEDALLEIINQFQPLLKKYARKLNYEDAYFDLQLKLIEIIHNPAFSDYVKSVGQAVVYIQQSVIHEYIRLGKTRAIPEMRIGDLSEEQQYILESSNATATSYDGVEIKLLLSTLTPMEQKAIAGIILNHETAAQLARELGCTRQSINQAKQRGLQKLKAAYQANR